MIILRCRKRPNEISFVEYESGERESTIFYYDDEYYSGSHIKVSIIHFQSKIGFCTYVQNCTFAVQTVHSGLERENQSYFKWTIFQHMYVEQNDTRSAASTIRLNNLKMII